MGVVIWGGAVDINVKILARVFGMKIQLPPRHTYPSGQQRQASDIPAKGGKCINLLRFKGLTDLYTIGLKNWSLTGNVDFGVHGTDGQLCVDANSRSRVDRDGLPRDLCKPLLLDGKRVCSWDETGESIHSIPVGDRFIGHGGIGVRDFHRCVGDSGSRRVRHLSRDASGDCRLSVQYTNAYQGKNCNERQKTGCGGVHRGASLDNSAFNRKMFAPGSEGPWSMELVASCTLAWSGRRGSAALMDRRGS